MATTTKYRAMTAMQVAQKKYAVGDEVSFKAEEAEGLLKIGAIELASESPKKPEAK